MPTPLFGHAEKNRGRRPHDPGKNEQKKQSGVLHMSFTHCAAQGQAQTPYFLPTAVSPEMYPAIMLATTFVLVI